MAVTKRLRFEILKRDDHKCRYCGAAAPDVNLTVDHVLPTALGGTDDPSNLVAACSDCNTGKSSVSPDSPLVGQVAEDAERWARAIETVTIAWLCEREEMDELLDEFESDWTHWSFGGNSQVPRPVSWRDSVEHFMRLGIARDALFHFIGVAMRNQRVVASETWVYFCGCCWRHIESIQRDAKALLARTDYSNQKEPEYIEGEGWAF